MGNSVMAMTEQEVADFEVYMSAMIEEMKSGEANASGIAPSEQFIGITTDGTVREGLYSLEDSGASTEAVVAAAQTLLESLGDEAVTLPLDAPEWYWWHNAIAFTHGASVQELDDEQRELVLELLRASMSERGYESVLAAMRSNRKLGDLVAEVSGGPAPWTEWSYYVTFFGTPSSSEPWGWQLQGHHLALNFTVVGDHVVLGPVFQGSETPIIDDGPFAGTRFGEQIESAGLALIRALTPEQRETAILIDTTHESAQPPERWHSHNERTQAYPGRDNHVLPYEGIAGSDLTASQQALLIDLIEEHLGQVASEHAALPMEAVRAHIDETYFVWIGGYGDDDPFYYKVHSPVVLIEFDHHMGRIIDTKGVSVKTHIHSLVRFPNGNDYGKAYIGQHASQREVATSS